MSEHGMSEAGGLREVLAGHVSSRVGNLPGCSCGATYPGLPGDLPTPREWHLDHLSATLVAARRAPDVPWLCSQCGERPSAMVKIGTSDGWCTACLDEAVEPAAPEADPTKPGDQS